MLSFRFVALFVIVCLLVSEAESNRGKRGKDKKKKDKDGGKKIVKHQVINHGVHGDHEEITELRQELDELKEKVESGMTMNFRFHGDHEHHDVEGETINVNLNMEDGDHHDIEAHCEFACSHHPDVNGSAHITQKMGHAHFELHFFHLGPEGAGYPVHVHQTGHINEHCEGLGPHFDPTQDAGNIGELAADENEAATAEFHSELSLYGPHTILGRSMAVHDPDGNILGCCTIVVMHDHHDDHHDDDHDHEEGDADDEDHSHHAHMNHGSHAGHGAH